MSDQTPSSSAADYETRLEAIIRRLIHQCHPHQTITTPPDALRHAIPETNTQASPMDIQHIFPSQPNPQNTPVEFGQEYRSLPRRQPLSTLCIAIKIHIKKISSTVYRITNQIGEVTIGSGSVSVTFGTGVMEDSCYIEYVVTRQRWRVAVPPSGIPQRIVEVGELMQGCQELVSIAGCVFKTSATTPPQHRKPIEIPARCLGKVMQSLGFCTIETGCLYRIFVTRFGRSIRVVATLLPMVDEHGENLDRDCFVESSSLKTILHVVGNDAVTGVIQRLRAQSRNRVITMNGVEVVKKKLSGCSSIVVT